MDAKLAELKKKLTDSLKRAAEIACQIQTLEQDSGIPHYDQIEIPAHEVGQQLSRLVQEQQAGGGGIQAERWDWTRANPRRASSGRRTGALLL